jgi:hypothetical protein
MGGGEGSDPPTQNSNGRSDSARAWRMAGQGLPSHARLRAMSSLPSKNGRACAAIAAILVFSQGCREPAFKEANEKPPQSLNAKYAEAIDLATRTAVTSSPRPEWFRPEGVSVVEFGEGVIIVGVELSEPDVRYDEKSGKVIRNEGKQQNSGYIVNVLCRQFERQAAIIEGLTGKEVAKKGSKYWKAEIIEKGWLGLDRSRRFVQ